MNLPSLLEDISKRPNLKAAYDAGFDCGVNGANTENCHFRYFGSPEHTKAWEKGKRDAVKAASR